MYRHIVFHKSREKHTSGNEMSLSEQYSLREQFAHNVINVGYSMLVIWPQFRVWLLSNLKEFKIRTLKKKKKTSRLTVAMQLKFSGRFYNLTRSTSQSQNESSSLKICFGVVKRTLFCISLSLRLFTAWVYVLLRGLTIVSRGDPYTNYGLTHKLWSLDGNVKKNSMSQAQWEYLSNRCTTRDFSRTWRQTWKGTPDSRPGETVCRYL